MIIECYNNRPICKQWSPTLVHWWRNNTDGVDTYHWCAPSGILDDGWYYRVEFIQAHLGKTNGCVLRQGDILVKQVSGEVGHYRIITRKVLSTLVGQYISSNFVGEVGHYPMKTGKVLSTLAGRVMCSKKKKINTIYLIVDTTRIWMKTPTASTVKLRARYQRRP